MRFLFFASSPRTYPSPVLSLSPGNLHIGPGVKVAQLLNIAFDMCAWETLGCLMNGGTLYLRGPRRADWIKVMKTVDVIVATPSILVPHDPVDFPNVRVVATAGEPCPQSLADKWASQATFYNCCGPTEVSHYSRNLTNIKDSFELHRRRSSTRCTNTFLTHLSLSASRQRITVSTSWTSSCNLYLSGLLALCGQVEKGSRKDTLDWRS